MKGQITQDKACWKCATKKWLKKNYNNIIAAKDWNSLPNDLKECNILSIFKSKLKTFLKDLS